MTIILNILAWVGRQGTRAVAVSILLGLVMPPVSAFLRPYFGYVVFLMLLTAFLRVDAEAIKVRLRRPGLVIAALVWIMVVLPLIAVAIASMSGLSNRPDILLIIFMITAAPSITASPAFAYMLKLDGALSLTILVLVTIATPLTAPIFAEILFDGALQITSLELAGRLFGLLGGAIIVAWVFRRFMGRERIAKRNAEIDGINVCALFLFAVIAMDGVGATFLGDPLLGMIVLIASFAAALLQMALTMMAFFAADRADAFNIAISTGNRNMGLFVAALGSTLPDLTWLYFALGQFPIYFLPLFLQPLSRRIVGNRSNHR